MFEYLPLAFKALAHKAEIARVIQLLTPAINALRASLPELIPLLKTLAAELFPEMQRQIANDSGLVTFDVKWLQRSLNLLGEKISVDGDYGDGTKAAVKRFQAKHPPLLVDGWAGFSTVLAIGSELEKLKTKQV